MSGCDVTSTVLIIEWYDRRSMQRNGTDTDTSAVEPSMDIRHVGGRFGRERRRNNGPAPSPNIPATPARCNTWVVSAKAQSKMGRGGDNETA
mmetsp:Transcript_20542/g.37060  ORF Transcript_20542/g.37060 Transcript_20542/m.37060 type:complete len:92 (-) Transcript_20542:97-372(-)